MCYCCDVKNGIEKWRFTGTPMITEIALLYKQNNIPHYPTETMTNVVLTCR